MPRPSLHNSGAGAIYLVLGGVHEALALVGAVGIVIGITLYAVKQFIGLLGTVPDCGPGELAAADIDRLRDLAEGVLQLIELWRRHYNR